MSDKKIILVVAAVFCILSGSIVCAMKAKAEEYTIKSKNNICLNYDGENKIMIYAEDIEFLLNEIENLTEEFE